MLSPDNYLLFFLQVFTKEEVAVPELIPVEEFRLFKQQNDVSYIDLFTTLFNQLRNYQMLIA